MSAIAGTSRLLLVLSQLYSIVISTSNVLKVVFSVFE